MIGPQPGDHIDGQVNVRIFRHAVVQQGFRRHYAARKLVGVGEVGGCFGGNKEIDEFEGVFWMRSVDRHGHHIKKDVAAFLGNGEIKRPVSLARFQRVLNIHRCTGPGDSEAHIPRDHFLLNGVCIEMPHEWPH